MYGKMKLRRSYEKGKRMNPWSEDDGFSVEEPNRDYLRDVLANREKMSDRMDGSQLALYRLLRANGVDNSRRKQDAR